MTRITLVTPADATGPVEQTFAEIKSAFGVTGFGARRPRF